VVLGLRWCDVDLDGGWCLIIQTVTAVRHRVQIAGRTKTGNARRVQLHSGTVAVLRAHKARQAQEMMRLGRARGADALVFCHPDGRPYHPERFSREFDRRVERLGIQPRIRLHDLRHGWATMALGAGVPTKIVSERLGHSSTVITENQYQHVTPTMQTDAAETVAGQIFGA
jgi:integrase